MGIKETTGGFTSAVLLEEEMRLTLPSLTVTDALEIGEIAATLGKQRKLPIAIEVRIGDWIVGFFLDGENAQQPVMMGVLPGIK